MNHRIRLGPLAIFLTIITAVLTTLAILTVATSRADTVLAQRFAEVTGIRYELEAEGARFVKEADEGFAGGNTPLPEDAAGAADGSVQRVITKDGYELHITVRPSRDGRAEVTEWRLVKLWEEEDPFEDLWPG